MKVSVLLSTYNGSMYLRDQLDSILSQSYHDFILYIRDDFSTDDTVGIIKSYSDSRISLICDELGNIGPSSSFVQLLVDVQSDIYLFCDQDDCWNNDKIEKAVKALVSGGIYEPLLYHTDLSLVDSDLHDLGVTFNQLEDILVPSDYAANVLVVQNCVVGCSVAVTEALVEISKIRCVDPVNLAMHDWWLALSAVCFGRIIYDNEPSIRYRQHSRNVSGVSRRMPVLLRIFNIVKNDKVKALLNYRKRIKQQAFAFMNVFEGELTCQQFMILKSAVDFCSPFKLITIVRCFRYDVLFKKFYMNLAFLLLSLFEIFSPKR